MSELMPYEELKELGEAIRMDNEEIGEAITQLVLHIETTDAQVFGNIDTITLMIVVMGLAGWVLRLAFKIARLQGEIMGKK